ncbi:putative DHD superfamily phosphohydrolase [Leptolyngbya sp. PCC 7375]|nr:putative DHD superfamily phosphohydrolase [Leptolyngbya sp. PCC 7375]
MKTLIIYHQVKPGVDCSDGIASAWVAAKKYPDYELRGCVYNAELPVIPEDCDRVVIVDFSFNAKILEQWREQVSEVIVIDHHKTAMNDLAGLSNKVIQHFDMNECGATLAWRTFFPEKPVPVFLDYVRDRDLWNHELPRTREVHEAISQMRYGLKLVEERAAIFTLFNALSKLSGNEVTALGVAVAGPKIKAKDEKVAAIANRWTMHDVAGHNVPVVFLNPDGSEDRLVSDVCSKLYTDLCPDNDFVACFTADKCWSLRSDKRKPEGGFDVGALAKSMGGGGHHNAAGFGPVED